MFNDMFKSLDEFKKTRRKLVQWRAVERVLHSAHVDISDLLRDVLMADVVDLRKDQDYEKRMYQDAKEEMMTIVERIKAARAQEEKEEERMDPKEEKIHKHYQEVISKLKSKLARQGDQQQQLKEASEFLGYMPASPVRAGSPAPSSPARSASSNTTMGSPAPTFSPTFSPASPTRASPASPADSRRVFTEYGPKLGEQVEQEQESLGDTEMLEYDGASQGLSIDTSVGSPANEQAATPHTTKHDSPPLVSPQASAGKKSKKINDSDKKASTTPKAPRPRTRAARKRMRDEATHELRSGKQLKVDEDAVPSPLIGLE